MAFNYKDLTYIRVALQRYQGTLCNLPEEEREKDELCEIDNDIMYLSRLIALTNREIEEWESKPFKITSVRSHDEGEGV